jgi:FtsP/CotA-like multicopper oxidase with cupredoxin domain
MHPPSTDRSTDWSRRHFIRHGVLAVGGISIAGPLLSGCSIALPGADAKTPGTLDGVPLRFAPELHPVNLRLRVAPGTWDLGRGTLSPHLLVEGQLPSPLLRIRRGETFRVRMENRIDDPLILHWHGLTAPDDMDGHPKLAVSPGEDYAYEFPVTDRAGTYWYHSHAHHLTGRHTYQGIAGLLIVDDPEEERGLTLPPAERELPLILQDRRLGPDGIPVYEPVGPSMMQGFMGPEAVVNGTLDAVATVEPAVIRARILNGSNARIFRLALSNGRPLVLIGNDGGFLDRPHTLPWIDLAPAERVDILLDLRGVEEGADVRLQSLEFSFPGGMMMGGGMGGMGSGMAEAYQQGRPLDLLRFNIEGQPSDPGLLPETLPALPEQPGPAEAVRERRFDFSSRMMMHTINGKSYDMDEVETEVPFGDTEIWTFVNDSNYPHPVHLHATHFRVLERRGGRAEIFPWESGLKDTVLVLPGEQVRVAVRFTAHRGLYLLHCHNLEHEDHGMMQNIRVV